MNPFTEQIEKFDQTYKSRNEFDCFLPVNETANKKSSIKGASGKPNEEYYKWQFLFALVNSGMYAKDYIGTEVYFPKGNVTSAPIKFDAAIFDEKDWFEHYQAWRQTGNQAELDWLRLHLIGVIEFKRDKKEDVEKVFNQQLKPAIKESEQDFCLGVYYDERRLYLFRKQGNKILRYSDEFNAKGLESGTKDLSLHLPEGFQNIPTFDQLIQRINPQPIDRSKRTIKDLDTVSGVHSKQINDAMSFILRTMDENGLVNERGYIILLEILTLKVFDEKRNESSPNNYLEFYITDSESSYTGLNDKGIKPFLDRIDKLKENAEGVYHQILSSNSFDRKNSSHVKVLVQVVKQLQDFSFVLSQKTDLYQIIFFRFAGEFSKQQKAQFVTPLPIIDFLVNIVNPRNGETIIDPTVGIADFLSVSYVNSRSKLDDRNIFGLDIDPQMIMLATLNMLLNGDGNAILAAETHDGSILHKFDSTGGLLKLVPEYNKNGDWDNRGDNVKLKKFDVVLTNPPFGDDRAWRPTPAEMELAECYELWNVARSGDRIDKGLIFLENAFRILKENGRLGIVLSNSLASIDRWQAARDWLMNNMRVAAIFDLPANVFAETGVNTTLIVAYKPTAKELEKLRADGYKIFFKDIQRVGYEVRSSQRVKGFTTQHKIDYETFEVEIDAESNPVVDEEFTETVREFRAWCNSQEEILKDLFTKEK